MDIKNTKITKLIEKLNNLKPEKLDEFIDFIETKFDVVTGSFKEAKTKDTGNIEVVKLIEKINNLEVKNLLELVEALKKKFNIVTGGINIANNENNKEVNNSQPEEKEFSVIVESLGAEKLKAIKVIIDKCFKAKSVIEVAKMFKNEKGEDISLKVAEKLTQKEEKELSDLLRAAGAKVSTSS